MAVADVLQQVEIFSQMPTKDLNRVAGVARIKSFKRGEVIVKEGELGVAFYVISKGAVDVVKGLGTAEERTDARLHAGDFFGEMALFDNQVRSHSIRAAEDTECYVITKWDFNAELNAPGSKIAVALLPILARRLRAVAESHTH
jgi:CRP/FNR family cyclic AMP-dependent transcriptional regulator